MQYKCNVMVKSLISLSSPYPGPLLYHCPSLFYILLRFNLQSYCFLPYQLKADNCFPASLLQQSSPIYSAFHLQRSDILKNRIRTKQLSQSTVFRASEKQYHCLSGWKLKKGNKIRVGEVGVAWRWYMYLLAEYFLTFYNLKIPCIAA